MRKRLARHGARHLKKAETAGCKIILPVDVTVAQKFEAHAPSHIVSADHVKAEEMILDVGPNSVAQVESLLAQTKTLVWNGPFGAFELPPFDEGTNAIAQTAARLTLEGKLLSVAGGGDTVAALNQAGVGQSFTYVSTAGAPSSNGWKARPCRASPRCRRNYAGSCGGGRCVMRQAGVHCAVAG